MEPIGRQEKSELSNSRNREKERRLTTPRCESGPVMDSGRFTRQFCKGAKCRVAVRGIFERVRKEERDESQVAFGESDSRWISVVRPPSSSTENTKSPPE